jgi:predicted lipoprotein with Yx(FWY)xxD motif
VTRTRLAFIALLVTAFALAIAGCGGSDDDSSTSTAADNGSAAGGAYGGGSSESNPAAESDVSSGAVVSLGSVPDLGMVLVDSKGYTLYDFHKDKGTKSSCNGECAEAWPPLMTEGEPTVGNGAMASMLGTTTRDDGTVQVTYAGHPLYTFVGDKKPGEANGNDISAFGAEWYALMGNGEEPED